MLIRVKTLKELGNKRPHKWNQDGYMDYLYGTIHEAKETNGQYSYEICANGHPEALGDTWYLTADEFEIIKEHYDLSQLVEGLEG